MAHIVVPFASEEMSTFRCGVVRLGHWWVQEGERLANIFLWGWVRMLSKFGKKEKELLESVSKCWRGIRLRRRISAHIFSCFMHQQRKKLWLIGLHASLKMEGTSQPSRIMYWTLSLILRSLWLHNASSAVSLPCLLIVPSNSSAILLQITHVAH